MVDESNTNLEGVVCPVGPLGEPLQFEMAEIEPLLEFLNANEIAEEGQVFQRGTVTSGQSLDCCKQALGPGGAQLLSEALKGNDKIKAILFGTGSIGNDGAASVGDLLKENNSIETVYLGCNLIDAKGVRALSDSLAENSQVRALWLKRNPVGPEGAKELAELLGRNRNIRTLDLVNTMIGREGLADLVDALVAEDYPLERLYLGGNHFDSTVTAELFQLLLGNSHLKELYLSVNQLGDEGAAALSNALRENQTLRVLSLASNGIGPSGAKALCASLEKHPKIQSLDFGYARSTKVLKGAANQLGDQGAGAVAELIRKNAALKHINIRRNKIGIHGLKQIANALETNDSLLELVYNKVNTPWLVQKLETKLAENRIGKVLPEIPADIKAIKSVYR